MVVVVVILCVYLLAVIYVWEISGELAVVTVTLILNSNKNKCKRGNIVNLNYLKHKPIVLDITSMLGN